MSRNVLVTGGAQGIGRGIAQRLLRDGWNVAVMDNDAEALEEFGSEFVGTATEHGSKLLPVLGDVGDEKSVISGVSQIIEAFDGKLHGLVCNTGIACNKSLSKLSLADWNRVLAVNLTSIFLLARECENALRTASGAVVTISSTRALMSDPHTEAYSASKGGVISLTHALAISFGPDVRVNVISPGWIDVDNERKSSARRQPLRSAADHAQHPVGRIGRSSDIAGLTAWLLSEEAGFITGQNFVVDGGMTKRMVYV